MGSAQWAFRRLAEDVEERLIEEFDERNARLARAANQGGPNGNSGTQV